MTSARWNLIIDVDRCNGCYNCAIAAKDEYVDNAEPGYFAAQPRHGQPWVDVIMTERGDYPALDVHYLPVMCNHCDDAPCLAAARNGAVTKREDGIVVIDPEKAKGQKAIAEACPYGAAVWNEDLKTVQHWPFDAHLIDRGWTAPRCVEVCATGAISAVKVDDDAMATRVRAEALSVRSPEHGTRPRVYYKNLARRQLAFIAGTVVTTRDGVVECASDAAATLTGSGGQKIETRTDDFGDFRFEGLQAGSGPFEIAIEKGGARATVRVESVKASRFLGKLALK